jgi:hypothetical protein
MLTAKRNLLIGLCLSVVAAGCGGGPTAPSDGGGTTIAGTVNVTGGAAVLPGAAATGLTVSIVGTNRSAEVESSGFFQLTDVPSGKVQLLFKDAVVSATVELSNVGDQSLIEIQVQVSGSTATVVNEVRTDAKVTLCHRSDDRYHSISVSQSAEPAHRDHGDAKVGEPVPGNTSMTFDSNCQPAGPSVSVEKSTNGEDADRAPGPKVPVGSTVTWSYVVTNTGTVDLSNVAVTDDREGAVTCPATTLAVGASMTCTSKTGTAEAGQYTNVATVTASHASGQVTDTDESHYFGEEEDDDQNEQKVQLCHKTGNGSYHLIDVSVSAEPAHRAHGDAKPGEAVPGQAGKTFGSNCSVN